MKLDISSDDPQSNREQFPYEKVKKKRSNSYEATTLMFK